MAAFLEHQELGAIERRVKLGGTLPFEQGGTVPVELCLLTTGPFIVGAESATRGVALNLLELADVAWVSKRLGTGLRVRGRRLTIPRAARHRAERILALGALRAGEGPREHPELVGTLVEAPTDVESAWLSRSLAPGEIVLAWLRTASSRPIPSWLGGTVSARTRLLMTVRRFQAVAISNVGDASVVELDPQRARFEAVGGRIQLTHERTTVTSSRRTMESFELLGAAVDKSNGARALEVARCNWIARKPERDWARALVDVATRHGEPRGPFVAFLSDHDRPVPEGTAVDLVAALEELGRAGVPADGLVEVHRAWGFSSDAGRALVKALRASGEVGEPWALELHLALHETSSRVATDPVVLAQGDCELAEHLLDARERRRAVELLERRLHRLPPETLSEVLPPRDADLTRGGGGPTLRTRIFELLATARGDVQAPDVHAVTELARLHPLVAHRMRGLVSLADDDLRQRARAVLDLLDPAAETPVTLTEPARSVVRPLSDKLVNEVLRHPASRADSPFLAKLQELLAAAPKPDVGMLRDYCEELREASYPDAVDALREAERALGVTRVHAYVSRGAKGVGLRAYENTTPFVLIGGQHLTEGPFRMSRAELAFIIGAELAHVRFGHVRVTSNEVWAGALEKGQQGLDMALGVLPMLRGWRLADKAVKVTQRVPIPMVRRAVDAAAGARSRLFGGRRAALRENSDVISALNENLVVAHRVMQLTADRAGLVLAQDIRAALRGMLLIRRDYQAEIPSIERRGLADVLGLRAEDGHLAYHDLAVRIAALFSFYLSDEFVRLRAALYD